MPGPPPKPTEKKRALGNPGKRPLPKLASVPVIPQANLTMPGQLEDEGRKLWAHIASAAGSWLGPSDVPMLTMLCEAADRRAFMLRVLSDEGWSVMTEKGYPYRHPLVQALGDLEKQMTSWMSLLGLSSADRSRLGLAEVKARSKLEELQSKREKRSS